MPILIKDYTWKQTDEKITVRVPIKGVLASKADIFTCDNFIKVHYTPFLFEVCLRDVINEDDSICRVAKDEVIFELVKEEKGSWDVLEAPLSKAEILKTKQRAIDIAHQRSEAQQKKKAEKRQKISKLAIQEQIDLDTKLRNKIDNLRDHERNVAMREFEQWKQNKNTQELNNKIKAIKDKIENNLDVSKESKPASQHNETQKPIKTQNKIKSTKKFSDKNIFDEPSKKLKDKSQQQDVPTPRNSGKIGVTFTPREFPTPSRESKAEEENEWLAKQAEARRRTGFVIEDLRPEEHDPIWLKDKGDSFYKVGNHLGAISAYTLGIKLNPNLPALYSNRAAAQLALGNYRRVIQDTTKALELLTPCVEMNKSSRSLCCARRGTALCKIGMLQEGLGELEEAFRLCPDNKELEEDIKNVQTQLENSEDEESIPWDEREEVDIN